MKKKNGLKKGMDSNFTKLMTSVFIMSGNQRVNEHI